MTEYMAFWFAKIATEFLTGLAIVLGIFLLLFLRGFPRARLRTPGELAVFTHPHVGLLRSVSPLGVVAGPGGGGWSGSPWCTQAGGKRRGGP